jgi:branched-subunit amino acid aminotransferase/4-amino-4-deoxychorismate lyase
MSIEKSDYIWFDGEFVPWDEAKVHVMAHVLHYGSSVFEGIRCYQMSTGPAIFRLPEHVKRLFNSCKVYRMEIPFSPEQTPRPSVRRWCATGTSRAICARWCSAAMASWAWTRANARCR